MPDRARLAFGRSTILALCAMLLTVPAVALGANPAAPVAPKDVTPRVLQPGDATGFRLPFKPGVEVRIEQGWNTWYSHNGRASYAYDFGLHEGEAILAAASGVVSYTHSGEVGCGGPALRNHANLIVIDHPDGSSTQYGHLATVGVEVGDVVSQGQVIGTSGKSGYTGCMPHLHFARQLQGSPVTQSIPVYFAGHEDRVFQSGEIISAPASCPAPDPVADAAALTAGTFCGTYYGGKFDGPAYFSRLESSLRIDRKDKGPGGYWLDDASRGYSARWTGRFTSASWKYTFSIVAIGGVRVTLDGKPIVDSWQDNAKPVRYTVTQSLGAGLHELVVEHYTTGARDLLDVDWNPILADG